MEWMLGTAAIGCLLVAVVVLLKTRRPASRTTELVSVEVPNSIETERGSLVPPDSEMPSSIVVESERGQVMSMTVLSEETFGASSASLKKFEAKRFGRVLEPLMQIAPSLVTAGMANSKQLMEVVIDGALMLSLIHISEPTRPY